VNGRDVRQIKSVNKWPTLLKLGLSADSWAQQPQCSGPPYRQTPLSNNYKTVIRKASDAYAKLGKIKYADGNGDAPYIVPEPSNRCRSTVLWRIGLAGFSSTNGQIGYDPRGETLLSLVRGTDRSRSTRDGCPSAVDGAVRPLSRGLEREYAVDRGQDGPTRPSALISEPSDRWLPVR
jgi:hypothetical protein